jgi:hypothetical protein
MYGGYDEVGKLGFSPDGRKLVHRARTGERWVAVTNKVASAPFSVMRDPVLSPNGRDAFAASDGKEWFVVCDGRRGKGCSEVSDPVFSPDGRHLAYRAVRDGKPLLVCDGREGFEGQDVTWLGFSPDGRHLAAIVARDGQATMTLDGIPSPDHARVAVPERFDVFPGKVRYVVFDKTDDAKEFAATLVETDWPKDRAWEARFAAPAK